MSKRRSINLLVFVSIATGLIATRHAAIECHNTDHLTDYCELNKVFGTKHQINKINHDYIVYGIQAYKIEDNTATLKSSYRTETREDGTKIISIRIRQEILEELDRIAKESNYSRNEIINLILEYGIEHIQIM